MITSVREIVNPFLMCGKSFSEMTPIQVVGMPVTFSNNPSYAFNHPGDQIPS